MTIYLLTMHHTYIKKTYRQAFTCEKALNQKKKSGEPNWICSIEHIELITDQFMEQILQPKELHETNTNSSL